MEETAQVNNPPEVNQPTQTPIENPVKIEEEPKKNFSLIIILSFTTIIATLIAAFFYFQNAQLRNELQKNLPSPTPTETPDETADWEIYKSDAYKIEFKYPSNWYLQDNSQKQPFGSIWLSNKEITETEGDLSVILIDLIRITLTQCRDTTTQGSQPCYKSFDEYFSNLKSLYTKESIIDDNFSISGKKGVLVSGKYTQSPLEGIFSKIAAFPSINNYQIEFSTINQNYEKIFDQILSTVKFTN